MHEQFQEYEKAKEYYEKAIELNPDFAEAYNNFAILLNEYLHEYEKAKHCYEKAIKLDSNFALAYNNLAALYYNHFKDIKKAQEYFLLALEKDPSLDFVRKNLGQVSTFDKPTYISKFDIDKVRHLRDIKIDISKKERKHLFFTGKNGSGKTSVLEAAKDYMQKILGFPIKEIFTEKGQKEFWQDTGEHPLKFNVKQNLLDLRLKYEIGNYVIVFFNDFRNFQPAVPKHIENVELQLKNLPKDDVSKDFIKYLVYQDYKRSKINGKEKIKIDNFFDKIEEILKLVYKEENINFKSGIERDEMDFYITLQNGNEFTFNELSAGYSTILKIIFEIVLRTANKPNKTNTEGIILIDEPETHLHIELQKEIMPMLIKMFPNIQFIVATHSPFILNSISNVVIYDLEKQIRTEDISAYAYDGIVETYFENDKYSIKIKQKLEEFKKLLFNNNLSNFETNELRKLEYYFDNIPSFAAPELIAEYQSLLIQKFNKND